MNENNKGLRIAAGIVILVLLTYSIVSTVINYISNLRGYGFGFFASYWTMIINWVVTAAVGVFVLTRLHVGAGIAKCVDAFILLFGIIGYVGLAMSGSVSGTQTALYMLSNALSGGGAILLAVGFFKHNAGSKGLFIAAAALSVLGSVASGLVPLFSVYGVGSSSVPMIIFTLLGALVAIVPWILLAIYFGLQGKKSGPAAYAAPAQYSMPQGYAPQQQGNDLPGGNGGR